MPGVRLHRRGCGPRALDELRLLVHPIVVHTEVPTYLAGNVAKIISVTVASTISFFIMRYVVFSRRRWFKGRL